MRIIIFRLVLVSKLPFVHLLYCFCCCCVSFVFLLFFSLALFGFVQCLVYHLTPMLYILYAYRLLFSLLHFVVWVIPHSYYCCCYYVCWWWCVRSLYVFCWRSLTMFTCINILYVCKAASFFCFFLNSFFLAVTQLNCSTIIVITIIQQNRGKVHIYMGLQCQRKLSTVCYRVSITSAQIYSREVYLSVFPISRLYFECQSKRIVVNSFFFNFCFPQS